jgi:hypothetical protein
MSRGTSMSEWEEKATPEEIEWIRALQSGEYAKGEGYLNSDNLYCCLGVRCELDVARGLVDKVEGNNGYRYFERGTPDDSHVGFSMPRTEIRGRWGLPRMKALQLAEVNDETSSFDRVIGLIKEWIAAR